MYIYRKLCHAKKTTNKLHYKFPHTFATQYVDVSFVLFLQSLLRRTSFASLHLLAEED